MDPTAKEVIISIVFFAAGWIARSLASAKNLFSVESSVCQCGHRKCFHGYGEFSCWHGGYDHPCDCQVFTAERIQTHMQNFCDQKVDTPTDSK